MTGNFTGKNIPAIINIVQHSSMLTHFQNTAYPVISEHPGPLSLAIPPWVCYVQMVFWQLSEKKHRVLHSNVPGCQN